MADISFSCPSCQQNLEAPEEMGGEIVECPACSTPLTIPEAPPPALVREPECPSCRAPMEEEAVLCVKCGFHRKLNRKITTSLE